MHCHRCDRRAADIAPTVATLAGGVGKTSLFGMTTDLRGVLDRASLRISFSLSVEMEAGVIGCAG